MDTICPYGKYFLNFSKQILSKSHSPHCSIREKFHPFFSIIALSLDHHLIKRKNIFTLILQFSQHTHCVQRKKFFDFSNLILKLPLAHHLNQRKIFLNFFNYIIKISRVHHLNTRQKYQQKNRNSIHYGF